MSMKRLVVLLVAVGLLASCSSDESSSAEDRPSVEDAAVTEEATTSTTTADRYAVPKVIDVDYINRVLAAHEELRSQVRRDVLATHQFDESNQRKIKALYVGDALEFQLGVWTRAAHAQYPQFKPNPGPAIEIVNTVHHLDQDCIWVTTLVDDDPNQHEAKGPGPRDVVLKRTITSWSDKSLNPTPWMQEQATASNYLTSEEACG